jgi:hypothetical protein
MRQILLTTCVGSVDELEEMVLLAGGVFQKVWQLPAASASGCPTPAPNSTHAASSRPASSLLGAAPSAGACAVSRWSPEAVRSLYHFMRCSQLEYVGQDGKSPIQASLTLHKYL